MQSLVCTEPGKLQLENRAEPVRKKNEVKIKIKRVGLCGTDFHIYEGLHPFLQYPRVMGHEVSGEVFEIDEGSEFKPGDPVILNPYLPCGTCIACRKEKPNCCVNISVLGVHADGGMCEYLIAPVSAIYSAKGLTLDQCAMVEFLSVGAHGVRRGEVRKNDRVLVVGAGPIGLGAAFFALIAGASVTLLDVSKERVNRAASLVKNSVGVALNESAPDQLKEITDGEFFDVVLDATGNKHAMQQSLHYVAHGGTCVFISVVKDDITFSDPLFHSREMRIIGSRNATRVDFEHVIESIRQDLIPTDQLNTHSATLDQLPELFPHWIESRDSMIKAIVRI